MQLNLLPIYKENGINSIYSHKTINLLSFNILQMIGLGGFSKVFLGNFLL